MGFLSVGALRAWLREVKRCEGTGMARGTQGTRGRITRREGALEGVRIIQRGHATSQHKVTTLLYEGMRVVLG